MVRLTNVKLDRWATCTNFTSFSSITSCSSHCFFPIQNTVFQPGLSALYKNHKYACVMKVFKLVSHDTQKTQLESTDMFAVST